MVHPVKEVRSIARAGKLFILSLCVLMSLGFSDEGTVEEPPPSPEAWLESFEVLEAVDDDVTDGRRSEALSKLETAEAEWPKPLSQLAERYLKNLRSDVPPWSQAMGVTMFADQVGVIDDSELRFQLEEMVLGLEPPRDDACTTVLLGRGLSEFRAGNTEKALETFRLAASEYPGSRLEGVLVFNAGTSLRDLKRYDEAISEFKRLLDLEVNNRAFVATSIMDMGYQNYHYRAAVNISWCYEQLGSFVDAYHWIELADSTYPYEGWCGVEINSERLFVAKTADRLARAAGGGLAVRHVAGASARNWPAWLGWSLWGLAAAVVYRRQPRWRSRLVHSAVPVAALTTPAVVLLSADTFEGSFWLLGFGLWRWVAPVICFVAVAILFLANGRAARSTALVVLVAAAIGHMHWMVWYVRYVTISHLPMSEIQSIILTLLLPVSLALSACVVTTRAVRRKLRKQT